MELNESQKERFSCLIYDFLEEENIKIKEEWEGDFSKEDDFYRLINELENYIDLVKNY